MQLGLKTEAWRRGLAAARARMRLPKLPEFTREAKTAAGFGVSLMVFALLAALAWPLVGLYGAHLGARAMLIDARAAAVADSIRAEGLMRAHEIGTLPGVMELKRMEGRR